MTPDQLPTVCILAGGRGTRLGPKVASTPKPLLRVAGRPFLVHQLELLAAHGVSHVVLCVGYLGEQIEAVVGEAQFGISIEYSYDGDQPAGTLGAIRQATALLDDRFLVLYGDAYLRLDYAGAVAAWKASGLTGLMTVFRNDGRWGASNVAYRDGLVIAYDKSSAVGMHWIDFGLGGFTKSALEAAGPEVDDLSVLQKLLAQRGEMCGYEVSERFYEIGTPESLAETEAFLEQHTRA